MTQIRVGPHGRVVLPAEIRRAMGLDVGSTLVAQLEEGERLILEPRRMVVSRLRGSWSGDGGRSAVDDLLAERRAEAALEEAEIAGDEKAIARARKALSGQHGAAG